MAALRNSSRIKESLLGRFRWKNCGLRFALAWIACLQPGAAIAAQQPPEPQPIRTAAAAHGLSVSEAIRRRPIVLTARVTFYASGIWGTLLFVSDSSGAVFVNLARQPVVAPQVGTLVEVTGVSGPGEFASVVNEAHLRVLDPHSEPAKPVRVTRTDLLTGVFDSWAVEVQGQVHAVRVESSIVSLRISTGEGPIVALMLRQPGVDYQQFTDATVVVRGVAAPDFNPRRQMTGVHLFVQSVDDISTLVPGGEDPFAFPVRPIGHLANFDPAESPLNRQHFQGRATLDWPGRLVCLQDDSGGLCVTSLSPERIAVGAIVDVAGYPVFAVPVPAVEDAAIRTRVQEAPAVVAPRPASVNKILAGDYSGELVSLDGELVEVNSDTRDWRLTLKSNGAVYTATMPKDGEPGASPPWLEGSSVHVVGVCQQDVDARAEWDRLWVGGQRFQSFRILMRTKADVSVIRTPSWWTPVHTTVVFGVGLGVTLAFAAWVILLLKRVEQKTKELSLSEERFRNLAHHDALTGAPNRALFYDRALISLERAKRRGTRVGLLLLDLDHFKPINDNFGHEAGDRVLCAVADRALATVRKSDTVARMGGDEFAVLVSDLRDGADALMIGAKVLHAVCQPLSLGLQELPVSASVGVAIYPDDGKDIAELLRNADAAMYRSKNKARGRAARYQGEQPSIEDIESIPKPW